MSHGFLKSLSLLTVSFASLIFSGCAVDTLGDTGVDEENVGEADQALGAVRSSVWVDGIKWAFVTGGAPASSVGTPYCIRLFETWDDQAAQWAEARVCTSVNIGLAWNWDYQDSDLKVNGGPYSACMGVLGWAVDENEHHAGNAFPNQGWFNNAICTTSTNSRYQSYIKNPSPLSNTTSPRLSAGASCATGLKVLGFNPGFDPDTWHDNKICLRDP